MKRLPFGTPEGQAFFFFITTAQGLPSLGFVVPFYFRASPKSLGNSRQALWMWFA